MRASRCFILLLAALTTAGCMRQQAPAYYAVDPATGQMVAVMPQQPQPPAVLQYQPPQYQPQMAQQPPPMRQAGKRSGRGLLNSNPSAVQYGAPVQGGPYVAAPVAPGAPYYAAVPATYEPAYTLDTGDRLRVVVFGQEGISNSYVVDAGGNVNLPLVGGIPARGYSTQQLSNAITNKLKQGYVREPHVSVEVEAYRPFFILGEVTNPGQYPYVANMTVETAVAIAGGFAPRASKSKVEVTRATPGQQFRGAVPLNFPLRPGDTIVVQERWF